MSDAINYAILDAIEGNTAGLRKRALGEIYLTPLPDKDKEIIMDGRSYLRADWPEVQALYATPNPTLMFGAGSALGNPNLTSYPGKFAYCPEAGTVVLIHSLVNGVNALARSTDKGVTWTSVTASGLTDPNDQIAISKALYVGTVLYVLRTVSTTKTVLDKSTDHGSTWSRVQDFAHTAATPFATRFYGTEVGSLAYRDGSLIVVFRPSAGNLSFHKSTDGGTNWTVMSTAVVNAADHPSLHWLFNRWFLVASTAGNGQVNVRSTPDLVNFTTEINNQNMGSLQYPLSVVSTDKGLYFARAIIDTGLLVGHYTPGTINWASGPSSYNPVGQLLLPITDTDIYTMGAFGAGNPQTMVQSLRDYSEFGPGTSNVLLGVSAIMLYTSIGMPSNSDSAMGGVRHGICLGDRALIHAGGNVFTHINAHLARFVTSSVTSGTLTPTGALPRTPATYVMRAKT